MEAWHGAEAKHPASSPPTRPLETNSVAPISLSELVWLARPAAAPGPEVRNGISVSERVALIPDLSRTVMVIGSRPWFWRDRLICRPGGSLKYASPPPTPIRSTPVRARRRLPK